MAVKKILFIIEKDQELLSMLDRVLQRDFVIYSFSKADDYFFKLLERLQPALVILEWLSYTTNSEEIISTVKGRYHNSSKILVISTHEEVQKIIPQNSTNGFLMKPFRLDQLKHSIHEALHSEEKIMA